MVEVVARCTRTGKGKVSRSDQAGKIDGSCQFKSECQSRDPCKVLYDDSMQKCQVGAVRRNGPVKYGSIRTKRRTSELGEICCWIPEEVSMREKRERILSSLTMREEDQKVV